MEVYGSIIYISFVKIIHIICILFNCKMFWSEIPLGVALLLISPIFDLLYTEILSNVGF